MTLETAEEHALWLATYGVAWGFHASDSDDTPPEDAADAAVRAYRERLPLENTLTGVPRGFPFEVIDADWRNKFADLGEALGMADPACQHPSNVIGCALDRLRGPTEGASDAAKVRAKCDQLDVMAGCIVDSTDMADGIRSATAAIRGCMLSPERPHTGGASPETVEDIGRPLAGLGFEMTRKMAKAMHASPDRIADAASGLGVPASVYQAATELNASEHKRLMESLEAILADGPGLNVIGLERKLRAALDTAKGGERPGVDVGMRSMDDWRSDTAKGDDDPQDV